VVTPLLPGWIRCARVSGYATAHAVCPAETRLFGTESLYGDWGGRLLLVAKDWGPSRILRARMEAGEMRPYRHEPGMLTNRRLQRLAGPFRDLGILYGSALGNLLRDDGRVSGSLPNPAEALAYGARVLRFTIHHMPRLEWIVCLGAEAWACACGATGCAGDWQAHRDDAIPFGPLIAAYHPAARVGAPAMQRPWDVLASHLVASRP
jgi:hypothetical protein